MLIHIYKLNLEILFIKHLSNERLWGGPGALGHSAPPHLLCLPLVLLIRGGLFWPSVRAVVPWCLLHSISQISLQFPVEFFPLFLSFLSFFFFFEIVKIPFQTESASWKFIRAVCHPEVASSSEMCMFCLLCYSLIWMWSEMWPECFQIPPCVEDTTMRSS